MKKIAFILIMFIIAGSFYSCEKELEDPKLDMSKTQKTAILNPQNGSSFVLTQDQADELFADFVWSKTIYNLTKLENTKYTLQMDVPDSNFVNPLSIVNTTNTMFEISVAAMNQNALALGLLPGQPGDVVFRLFSYLNQDSEYSNLYSDVITLTITPYEDLIYVKPIYLLGSGTTVGWDNIAALPMAHLGDARFARVEHLVPGADQFVKFISILGEWAPQWGTDATGTPEEGPLIYRPDEGVPDPDAIPVADTEGEYYIEADTANLTYKTFLTSGELYLVGDATPAGWDNTAGLPFTEDSTHIFSMVVNLTASGGMKFLEVPGEWAPQ
ncbi:MAG: SusE domain-containing protein, partial [Bacteroidales bacterium]|nr:SusE domain-containing protein [Bacteroidales bacterium]